MLFHRVFGALARHGRLVLIGGLVAGAVFPDLAFAMRPFIGEMVAGLLFFAALRVGPRQALGALGDVGTSVGWAATFQLLFPLLAVLLFSVLGLAGTAAATFFVLMLAAPPISGTPNLTVLCGGDPAPSLRQLVVGTALVPLTVLPSFWLTPAFGDPHAVIGAAGGLMILIVGVTSIAFALRATALPNPSVDMLRSIDGMAAVGMAVVVVGLMSAVGPALRQTPVRVGWIVLLCSAVNFALQALAARVARSFGAKGQVIAVGIASANRNTGIFLTVLPDEVVDPILLLIGCYQIPMYITPAVMTRFYARLTSRPAVVG